MTAAAGRRGGGGGGGGVCRLLAQTAPRSRLVCAYRYTVGGNPVRAAAVTSAGPDVSLQSASGELTLGSARSGAGVNRTDGAAALRSRPVQIAARRRRPLSVTRVVAAPASQ